MLLNKNTNKENMLQMMYHLEEKDGILLYGTNAVGKTSIIRSISITVIMAQAGLFVPCEKFEYYPYKNIFSRILGNDNLFKGLSLHLQLKCQS